MPRPGLYPFTELRLITPAGFVKRIKVIDNRPYRYVAPLPGYLPGAYLLMVAPPPPPPTVPKRIFWYPGRIEEGQGTWDTLEVVRPGEMLGYRIWLPTNFLQGFAFHGSRKPGTSGMVSLRFIDYLTGNVVCSYGFDATNFPEYPNVGELGAGIPGPTINRGEYRVVLSNEASDDIYLCISSHDVDDRTILTKFTNGNWVDYPQKDCRWYLRYIVEETSQEQTQTDTYEIVPPGGIGIKKNFNRTVILGIQFSLSRDYGATGYLEFVILREDGTIVGLTGCAVEAAGVYPEFNDVLLSIGPYFLDGIHRIIVNSAGVSGGNVYIATQSTDVDPNSMLTRWEGMWRDYPEKDVKYKLREVLT